MSEESFNFDRLSRQIAEDRHKRLLGLSTLLDLGILATEFKEAEAIRQGEELFEDIKLAKQRLAS